MLPLSTLQVRVAALGALVPLAQTLPSSIKRSQVLPLIRKYMQPLELDAPLQRLLAGMFAQVVAMVGEGSIPRNNRTLIGLE